MAQTAGPAADASDTAGDAAQPAENADSVPGDDLLDEG
jgi:hypothetical protein